MFWEFNNFLRGDVESSVTGKYMLEVDEDETGKHKDGNIKQN